MKEHQVSLGGKCQCCYTSGGPTRQPLCSLLGHLPTPCRSPALIGCFIVDRQYFQEIGLLDEGMEVYGGENVELGIRVSGGSHPQGVAQLPLQGLSLEVEKWGSRLKVMTECPVPNPGPCVLVQPKGQGEGSTEQSLVNFQEEEDWG